MKPRPAVMFSSKPLTASSVNHVPAEPGDRAARDHGPVAGAQHVDAHGVGGPRVLADGPDPQAPAGAEQRPRQADDQQEHQVHVDRVVEEQRPDERDVLEHRDAERPERAGLVEVLVLDEHPCASGSW